jgi:hypothetical protein
VSTVRPDESILTDRLDLRPVAVEDADELAAIFADRRLYAFTGGDPSTLEALRSTFARLADARTARQQEGHTMTEANVSFAGNLTDDPEVRYTDSAIAQAHVPGGRQRSAGAGGVVLHRDRPAVLRRSLTGSNLTAPVTTGCRVVFATRQSC